jgi:hypothetical protein
MSTRASASNLSRAVQDLSAEWQETKAHWRDAKSLEFEARFLEKLADHVAKAKPVMEEIETLLGKVRKDCE